MIPPDKKDIDPQETQEWIESLEDELEEHGFERTRYLLEKLVDYASSKGARLPFNTNTPFINTISTNQEPPFVGNREIERKIKSIIRWNAMAMVVSANTNNPGIGGHISTYASAATLYEIGFNHFFKGPKHPSGPDLVFFQGHASPGIYARAYLEGRVDNKKLQNFRRELTPSGGLSSYPHPWLMPNFWQFATVSMGLGPLMAVYQARFMNYLIDRKLMKQSDRKVWAFLGDGEMDEPEATAGLTLAAREQLDNLIFVVNCNLQRLDGPVRGNSKVVQELEGAFRGAGWNVIKVIWGSDFDQYINHENGHFFLKRVEEIVDGDLLKYVVEGGAYIREHFWGKYPELLKMVEQYTDDELWKFKVGGHDPAKVYAAFSEAVNHKDQPTVILAQTIKGYGLGEAGEGRNITHSQKKLNEDELLQFRSRFDIPLSDEECIKAPFYKPGEDSEEIKYLKERRNELKGFLPKRFDNALPLTIPPLSILDELLKGSGDRDISTTMAFVRALTLLTKDENIGKHIVPIIPDEARTFGIDPLFRQLGIYSHAGQVYDPVDSDQFLYYREATDGQILEEGISEAGAMSSFTAAGMSYSVHREPLIPFYTFYSMFGFQRVGDLIWCAADARARGFLLGATAGRTTLNGEGLQHQDGHSLLLASTVPSCLAYDPAFAYETAVIVEEGLRQMYELNNDRIYYITLYNENYEMPAMPKDSKKGILKGLYLFKPSSKKHAKARLFGSGSIMRQVIQAAEILEKDFKIPVEIWSVPSYVGLRREALECEDWNRLNPTENPKTPYIVNTLGESEIPTIAASDYMKAVPEMIARWVDNYTILGTDGFGMSDTRESLRRHFQIDSESIVVATLSSLSRKGEVDPKLVEKTIVKYKLDRSRQIHSS